MPEAEARAIWNTRNSPVIPDGSEKEWRVTWHDKRGIVYEDPAYSLRSAERTHARLVDRGGDRYKAVKIQYSEDSGKTWVDAEVKDNG